MSNSPDTNSNFDHSYIYQIRVDDHLEKQWAEWFGDMTVTLEGDGTTLITGSVMDDAALHGLLKKIRDAGLKLISVNRVKNE